MKILFLDDNEERHDFFQKNSIGHDVWHVRTAAQAIATLNNQGPFDVASLDHDLGGTHYTDPNTPGHGMEVARYIAQQPTCINDFVIVHSYNTPAGLRMVEEMAPFVDCSYRPFAGWLPNNE